MKKNNPHSHINIGKQFNEIINQRDTFIIALLESHENHPKINDGDDGCACELCILARNILTI